MILQLCMTLVSKVRFGGAGRGEPPAFDYVMSKSVVPAEIAAITESFKIAQKVRRRCISRLSKRESPEA